MFAGHIASDCVQNSHRLHCSVFVGHIENLFLAQNKLHIQPYRNSTTKYERPYDRVSLDTLYYSMSLAIACACYTCAVV